MRVKDGSSLQRIIYYLFVFARRSLWRKSEKEKVLMTCTVSTVLVASSWRWDRDRADKQLLLVSVSSVAMRWYIHVSESPRAGPYPPCYISIHYILVVPL